MKKKHNDSVVPKNQKQVELADIFRLYADDYRRSHALSYEQLKVMRHMQSVLLQVPSRCLTILAAIHIGLPYQTTASSQLITAELLLPTGIGKKTMKSKK